MKTLKESILDDIDVSLQKGDDYINSINEKMRGLNRAISSASTYVKLNPRIYVNGRRCTIPLDNVLQHFLGYDAIMMEITIYQLEDDLKDWHLDVFLYKRDGCTCCSAYNHTIYLYNGYFSKFDDILKKLLKPATKNVETFKHFLQQVIRYEGQLVMKEEQLLK